jgi:putative SOS response-associated peptidase YedK
MVTQAPGLAIRVWHHRAPVVLAPAEWKTWLDLGADVAPILARESSDNFSVEQVR